MNTMLKKFFKYELQSVAGMVGISIYILADTFFIALYGGADGLAVLNLILPVYGVIYAIGAMIGIGSATRYGLSSAKGETTDHYFLQSIFWCLIFSIPFIIAGIAMPDTVLKLLGADQGLTELGRSYLRIVLIATPCFMCNYTFTGFARNDNAPMIAMIASITGSMCNIVLDYVLMFPVKMGLAGAALGTALSPIITMSVCCIHYLGKNNHVGFKWRGTSVKKMISCCQLGVSAFVGEISSAVIAIIFNMLLLNIAGNIGVAAYGVVANTSIVGMSIFNGLAQGVQPLMSESYGKHNLEQVKKLLRLGLRTCLIAEIIIVAFIWIKTDMVIAIFNSEQNMQLLAYAHTGLRLYFLGFLVAGINIMLVAYFAAIDHVRPAMVGSLLRGAVAIAVCAIIFAKLFGINGVWLSFLGSEMITIIVLILMSGKDSYSQSTENSLRRKEEK